MRGRDRAELTCTLCASVAIACAVLVACLKLTVGLSAAIALPHVLSPWIAATLGTAALMARSGNSAIWHWMARVIGAAVAAVAFLSLTHVPLVIAPRQYLTAILLLGLALACLDARSRFLDPTELFNGMAATVLLLALAAYGLHFWPYYGNSETNTVGVATLLLLLCVCAGIATLRPERGVIQVLRSRTPAGHVARVLLPIPFSFPFLFSAVNSYGMSRHWYDPQVGIWLFAVANTTVFALLIGWAALLLYRADRAIEQANEQLRLANDHLERRVHQRTAELREEARERLAAMEELARSNAELEQFAYVAAHDLQEPLRNVTNYVQLFRERHATSLNEDASLILGVVESGSKRMSQLVRDLLAYSRVMHDDIELSLVDCAQLVSEVLADMSAHTEQIAAQVRCGPMPVLVADASKLRQIVQNLISNALKYRDGDTPPVVEITAQEQPHEWVFAVRDNGIGISREYHERIFGLFKRLHRDEYPGTGVGLAICKRAVQMHGGRIWVVSKVGEGSTFFFSLPKRSATPVAISA